MSDEKAWDDKVDGALVAWPPIKAPDEAALAEKTLNRIRANFPPKSKLTLNDDALVGSPFPATRDDQRYDGGPDATLETQVNPFADVTQEIRPEAQRTLREKSRPDLSRDEIRAATHAEPRAGVPTPVPTRETQRTEENQRAWEKSSQIGVPIARASSIPPPSSGVGTSQKKAEDRMGQVERQRDRTSFKDLAKLAATPPPGTSGPSSKPLSAKVPVATPSSSSSLKGDSGVVDLQAAALSDPHGAERAKSTPLASGSLFDEDAPLSGRGSVPPPSSGLSSALSSGPLSAAHSAQQHSAQQIDPYAPASVRPSIPPSALSAGRISAVPVSAGPHSAVAAMQQPQKAEPKKSRVGVILFSLVGVAAVAAAGVLYVHTHHAAAIAAADTKSVQAPTQPAATEPAQNGTAVAQADQPAAAGTIAVDDPSLQNAAQNGTASGAKTAAKPVAHAASKSSKPSGMLKDAMEKTEADTPSAPVVADKATAAAKDEAPPAVGGSPNLQNAMQTAAGPSDSTNAQATPTGPKFAPGSVPQRPSQGALASAIGRVLPDARSCLGPDDGVSYANIVFESSGGVQNVTLSGYAANKPAGACITTALKKGSIGPFAEPTYSAKVTVRP